MTLNFCFQTVPPTIRTLTVMVGGVANTIVRRFTHQMVHSVTEVSLHMIVSVVNPMLLSNALGTLAALTPGRDRIMVSFMIFFVTRAYILRMHEAKKHSG